MYKQPIDIMQFNSCVYIKINSFDRYLQPEFSFCAQLQQASLSVRRRVTKLHPRIFWGFKTVGNRLAAWQSAVMVGSFCVDKTLMTSSVSKKKQAQFRRSLRFLHFLVTKSGQSSLISNNHFFEMLLPPLLGAPPQQ